MDRPADPEREDLLAHVLVPVADEEDARATCRALCRYAPKEVRALHVVEKGEGVPDKTPVEQSDDLAESAFTAVRAVFPDAETEVAYGRDVVGTIIDTAREREATAIVFRPRGGSRLVQLLAGDRALRLVTDADTPVVALNADPRDEG